MTKSVTFFYGEQGIRRNAVCPGGLGQVMGVLQATTHGQVAEPEQIASVIPFLASDEATNVNGAILPADHGWSVV